MDIPWLLGEQTAEGFFPAQRGFLRTGWIGRVVRSSTGMNRTGSPPDDGPLSTKPGKPH